MRNSLLNKLKLIIFILLFGICSSIPIAAAASEIPVQFLGAYGFQDHKGMIAKVNERYVYCIERGNPFRSAGSDMQMIYVDKIASGGGWGGEYEREGYLSETAPYLYAFGDDVDEYYVWRGWGQWEINGDHTDAIQVGTDGAPSSTVWYEEFDEDKLDDEDPKWDNRYPSGLNGVIQIRKFFEEVKMAYMPDSLLTGHEGAVEPYPTNVKRITYADAGFSMSQVYAQAITNYYIWEDPDASGYSENVKYGVKQALDWGIEFDFVTTMGGSGKFLRIIYQNSTGNYGVHKANTYLGTCDGYMKTTIGTYEELKLYRQVIWKTTNMRQIPSFASYEPEEAKLIKLYWDEEQHLYTTTVSDHNGVLNYFDFAIPGCSVTNNEDGTLTISSSNQIGTITSSASQSKLEPADGVFKLPRFFRWVKEGTVATFKYTMLSADRSGKDEEQFQEAGNYGEGLGRMRLTGFIYNHSHNYSPACNWFCDRNPLDVTHCTLETRDDYNNCKEEDNAGWNDDGWLDEDGNWHDGEHHYKHEHHSGCHTHYEECWHMYTCPYYKNYKETGFEFLNSALPNIGRDACERIWCCGKQHFNVEPAEISGTYIDWQDLAGEYVDGQKLIDPEMCYIKVKTVPHEFPAETDTEILLIADHDEWNNLTFTAPNGKVIKHADHLRVGEKYHLKYIYSYRGASKGFRIESSLENKPYYQYNYLARMQRPENNEPIYGLRTGLSGDRFSQGSISVPHAKLVQDLTDIKIRGLYQTPETAYTLNGAYSWDSGSSWNDRIYLDALVDDQFDDNYDNKDAGSIASNSGSPLLTDFTVSKPSHNDLLVVWEFDTEPEVFSSALVYGTAYIEVEEDDNYTKSYFDAAYNYSKDKMAATQYTDWFYDFEDHNNVGGVGYFSSEYTGPGGPQSDNPVPSHTVYTQNNEYRTYAIKNKVWQSDVDIKVSNFVQNTGAGITEHIYQERGRDSHDLNYNLYYTVDVENPKATIYENKQKSHDGQTENDVKTTPYDTTSDINEFDVNTMVSWGATGAAQTGVSYGKIVVVDHIKTGRTYIQREIPTILTVMTDLPKETMSFKVYPNYDRLIYEDYFAGISISGENTDRKVTVSVKDDSYPSNEQTAVSDIWPAMNPNVKDMQPQNIGGSNNVPDKYNQGDNALHHIAPITSFNIKLSNGETKTVVDSHTKNYTQYDFEYNGGNRNNKVTFSGGRKSIMFFKYSKTNYGYNGNGVQSAVGDIRNSNKTQTESYYISQVLFKSNYTSKYKKELEAQGADYIEDLDADGNLINAWVDMVNQNKFAIVSAGQGFELRVTLKYENSYLTQYLSRYFGQDDGQNDMLGTSNRVQKNYLTSVTEKGRQFANISALTGKDGRTAPFYKDTERAYISSNSILDRLAVNLVTGSNVFNDLYVFMSDNPDTVYSYSGIYGTPVVFERNIKYSDDFAVTTVTYTMCLSHENGIASRMQNMKFYTNQLAPDKKSPGIVEGMTDVSASGEHSITIWTPIVAATPFDYPNTMEDRYIGDAIELGYTIKTTGADDSIVHIVQ